MLLKKFANAMYEKGTLSETRIIEVVFSDGRRFKTTAKQLDTYCKTGFPKEINGIIFGGTIGNFQVVSFYPIDLIPEDIQKPSYNKSVRVEIV